MTAQQPTRAPHEPTCRSKIFRLTVNHYTLGINPGAADMPTPDESPEAMFQRILRMDERLARALTSGGIVTLEELAYVPIDEVLGIEGLQESEVQLFRTRARAYLLNNAMGPKGDADTVDA
jgi:transcription termination factor NusA